MKKGLAVSIPLFVVSMFQSVQGANDSVTNLKLSVQKTCSLETIWNDKGSGAAIDGFFYIPYVTDPTLIIGGYGSRTKKLSSTDCVMTVNDEKHLVTPIDWELIWKDKGSGARKDGSMWRAIPPDNNHVCIGTVPQRGYEKPYIPNYRCVHSDFAQKVITNSLIWSDKGSGAKKKVTMFKLPNSGSFVAVDARLAQLETYDLKVDSSLSGTVDETNIQDSTRISDNEKTNSNTGKKPLSVMEQIKRNLEIKYGTPPPEDEGCYYDRGQKKCDEAGYKNFIGIGLARARRSINTKFDTYNQFKREVCKQNNGIENAIEWHREEAKWHPAASDKRFGTVVIDCVSEHFVMAFGIDNMPANEEPNKLLWERIMLYQKLVDKTPVINIGDTDGIENEFERQIRELCAKNNIQFHNGKTY